MRNEVPHGTDTLDRAFVEIGTEPLHFMSGRSGSDRLRRMSLSPRPPSPPRTRNEDLLAQLEALGFFRHTSPDRLKPARHAILRDGWPGIFSEGGRVFAVDAEELADGGVAAFLEEVRPFLEGQGVNVPPLVDHLTVEYTLLAGEDHLPIWTRDDFNRDLGSEPGRLWGVSSTRTVQILNQWLQQAESCERAYGVNGGNEFFILFLTPELLSLIQRSSAATPQDAPYVPNLEYPGFGQPW